MTADSVELDAVRFAALVAPAITRTFVSGMRAAGAEGRELAQSYGGAAVGYLIDLRNPFAAGRSLTMEEIVGVYPYTDPQTVRDSVERSEAAGLLEPDDAGAVRASERGHELLAEVYALHDEVLAERWPVHFGERLNPLLERLLAEAGRTGGAAWAVQAPPHEPDGIGPAVVLLNRLSTMRFHRADSHAAAWQTAGWTEAQVEAMPWGSPWSDEREAIEHDTNARAAAPFTALTPDERLQLLADLAALA